MYKQTIGFNWGAAGVGTSVWTGVPLRVLLNKCGITKPTPEAQHVCFRGPAGELPKGEDGSYGTSIPMYMALDPAADVILAYQQNHQPLQPDHGYPIRIIIPGWIGGRMVKFLEEITVSSEPSENFYHFNDNRILPPNVDAEKATKEGWWYKQNYIFNQLNINSAIAKPAHEEMMKVPEDRFQMYTVSGYAYTGDGNKLTRVEVSLDGGYNWLLTDIDRPEKPNAYGKYWCWVFWSITIPVVDLCEAVHGTIRCRAWDEANNTQPKFLTWNVMGMGNNCHFTIKIHRKILQDGGTILMFEHPTQAGAQKGGWMGHSPGEWTPDEEEVTQMPASALEGAEDKHDEMPVMKLGGSRRVISMAEVGKHDTDEDCWIVVRGRVYDTTAYLPEHPGGASSITINAGTDCTEEFEAIHSKKAWKLLENLYIGDLKEALEGTVDVTKAPVELPHGAASSIAPGGTDTYSGPIALNPKQRLPFQLVAKKILSHNVIELKFALQSALHVLGLPVGTHLLISARVNGKLVMRAYTPVSTNNEMGFFRLLIKIYRKSEQFPLGGLLSQHFDSMKIGDSIEAKGPIGHITYRGNGNYLVNKQPHQANKICLVAGGTGITPCYQFIMSILEHDHDPTEIFLVYCNTAREDIMLFDELEEYRTDHPKRLKIHYMLSQPSKYDTWTGGVGRVSEAVLKEHFPKSGLDVSAFMCGPEPMQDVVTTALKSLGFEESRIIKF